MNFYVYALFRPTGEPCYIGKGSGNRVLKHAQKARSGVRGHLYSIIRDAGGELPYVILHKGLDERTAYEYEDALVCAVGREVDGGPLVNQSRGGRGGSSGVVHDEEFRRKRREHMIQWFTPERRAALSERMKGNAHKKGKPNSELWRQKTIERMTGNTYTLGWEHTDESKAKLSKSLRGRKCNDETKAKMAVATKRRWESDSYREKSSERMKGNTLMLGRTHSEETRAKISAATMGKPKRRKITVEAK